MESSLTIPASDAVINVSIIDSTADLVGEAGCSVMPEIPGQPYLNFKTYVFLLEHPEKGVSLLFDGGLRKDWWNLAPANVEFIESEMPGLRVTKNINELLREGGINDKSIDAIIWSHHHYDHIGDASLFPTSTKIIVGPGFKNEFLPGYPTDQDGVLLDSDIAGRTVQEIDFGQSSVHLGSFRAHDYFADGSLYILDTPGHATGHLSVLARTTSDTFVFLGGDVCDAPQVWRPTELNPLPDNLPDSGFINSRQSVSGPTTCLTSCHRFHDDAIARRSPFSLVSDSEKSFYEDPKIAQQSVEALKVFDAAPNVFVAVAHDTSLSSVLRFFPRGTINDWKAQGWKQAAMWRFVDDLPIDGKSVTPLIVDGVYRGNEKVSSTQDVS